MTDIDLLVDMIALMLETEGPGISDVGPNGTPLYFYPVRERVQPVLLQAVLMGLNPLEVYTTAVEKFGQDAPAIQSIFGMNFLDGRKALAELYWDRQCNRLWRNAIREPPDWDAFRAVLAGAKSWGAWPEDVYLEAQKHYPLSAVAPLAIWERVRPKYEDERTA